METQSLPPRSDVSITHPVDRRPWVRRGRLIAAAALVLVLAAGAVASWMLTTMPATPAMSPRNAGGVGTSTSVPSEPVYDDADIPVPASYTVEPGDSLVAIAAEFETSIDALRLANGLTDVNRLQIGQALAIPPAATLIEPIDRGLTLRDAARRYEISPAVLAAYNGLSEGRVDTPIGREELLVPDRSRLGQPAIVETSGGDPSSGDPGGNETLYTVAAGDSLLSIAAEFDVDPQAIMAANRIEDADLLVMGSELRIPAGN
jgi:LysM repeat protein